MNNFLFEQFLKQLGTDFMNYYQSVFGVIVAYTPLVSLKL